MMGLSYLRTQLLLLLFLVLAAPLSCQTAVPTFECLGLAWQPEKGGTDNPCQVQYRVQGTAAWKTGYPLWYDARNREYRGSLVHLPPGTPYQILLTLTKTLTSTTLQAATWSEQFPVGQRIHLPAFSNATLSLTRSGTPAGYHVFEPGAGGKAVIDVANAHDTCINVDASYVILRGLTLRGARKHGIRLLGNAHDVIIEECDISGWGTILFDGWGEDRNAAIKSTAKTLARIIVQRNRIHHPRSDANNWTEARPVYLPSNPYHPAGPQAVDFNNSAGNHVIRYNAVYSDADHYFNDIFGAGSNFSDAGFPNADSDIHGNYLSSCWDDGIEAEGANRNVRIWGNYIENTYVKVAAAATYRGPIYIWQNVAGTAAKSHAVTDSSRGGFLKTGGLTEWMGGRICVFHNTLLQPAPLPGFAYPMGCSNGVGNSPFNNIVTRNNIFHLFKSWWQVFSTTKPLQACDFDHDLYRGSLTSVPGQEPHGIGSVVPEYSPAPHLDPNTLEGVFTLRARSRGHDAGPRITGFNDGFIGAGPDMGAHEAGSAPMEFGVDAYRGIRIWAVPNPAYPSGNLLFTATRGRAGHLFFCAVTEINSRPIPPVLVVIDRFGAGGKWSMLLPVQPGAAGSLTLLGGMVDPAFATVVLSKPLVLHVKT